MKTNLSSNINPKIKTLYELLCENEQKWVSTLTKIKTPKAEFQINKNPAELHYSVKKWDLKALFKNEDLQDLINEKAGTYTTNYSFIETVNQIVQV